MDDQLINSFNMPAIKSPSPIVLRNKQLSNMTSNDNTNKPLDGKVWLHYYPVSVVINVSYSTLIRIEQQYNFI